MITWLKSLFQPHGGRHRAPDHAGATEQWSPLSTIGVQQYGDDLADPYEQLVDLHLAAEAIEARLRDGIDAAIGRFLTANEDADARFTAALNEASAAAWVAAQDDLRHDWYEPIGATPWTRADWVAQRVATTWKGLRRNVRQALREATGPLPVIELAEIYREAVA